MLNIQNLSFNYGTKKILENLSLTIRKGETVALLGTSGSGKTTLLKIICNLLNYEIGKIEIDDSISYMTQQDLLLPWRNIEDNIKLACELEKIDLKSDYLNDLLDKLEITPFKKSYPHEISGGQYKRAMLARALAPQKNLLLLDEPFSSLDLPLRDKLYERLKTLTNSSMLLVTHDFRDAFCLADRIILLKQGRIEKEWIPDISQKENSAYLGALFQEFKEALIPASFD